MNLANKVALVTGGSQGIGKEIVRELLTNGIKGVAILDINENEGEKTRKEFAESFGNDRVIFLKTDVTNETNFEDSIRQTKSVFSGLDIIVNNAGIANEDNYPLAVDINLTGVIRGTLLGLKYLSKDKGGNGGIVVNIASLVGIVPFPSHPAYTATKFGVVGFVRSIGVPLYYNKSGVSVVAICPGFTQTELFTASSQTAGKERVDMLHQMMIHGKTQKPNSVGRAVVHVVKNGTTGTIWAITGSNLFSIEFPDALTMLKPVLTNIDQN